MTPHYTYTNEQIIAQLKEVLAAMEIKGASIFRIRAYQNAIESISAMTISVYDLWQQQRLSDINGVGEALKQHLEDLFTKGEVVEFMQIKQDLPAGMFSLIGIQGIGAKKAFKLARAFNLNDRAGAVDALLVVALKNEVQVLPGFGAKSEKDISEAIQNFKFTKNEKKRMLLVEAEEIAQRVLSYLSGCSEVLGAKALGSLRRREATVGDIDIAVATKSPAEVLAYFLDFEEIREVLVQGSKKASVVLNNEAQVDVRVSDPETIGAMYQYFTGSKQHNVLLRTFALEQGLSLSEYAIKSKDHEYKFSAEEDFYARLGLSYIVPELRQARDEILLAKSNSLPQLISQADIKGDLHMHTTASDGENSLLEMVKAAAELGYEYIGISDHAPSVANRGLKEVEKIIREQRRKINEINQSDLGVRVLLGYEVNILADAALSLPDELLALLDYSIGAIHTSFDQPREKMTARMLAAIENPYINIIAHPTGRLINERQPYELDWGPIFDAALQYKKAFEINSQPSRLDLPDDLAYMVREKKIKLLINTDAHGVRALKLMKHGIDVARRGWCTKEDVLNTLPFEDFLRQLKSS